MTKNKPPNVLPRPPVKRPVAPPVYRPQPTPKVLQTKTAIPGSHPKRATPNPQPAQQIIQRAQGPQAPHSVYLVGEGNFEYAAGLQERHPNWVVKATELLPPENTLGRERGRAGVLKLARLQLNNVHLTDDDVRENADAIYGPDRGIQFGVNAAHLDDRAVVSPRRYHELRFIFPHCGGGGGNVHAMQQYVQQNQPVIEGFFQTGRTKLLPGGHLKIALKQTPPYYYIDLFAIAQQHGFQLVHAKGFKPRAGFTHSITDSDQPVNPAGETSYKFVMLDGPPYPPMNRPAELPAPPQIPQQRAAAYTPGRAPAVPVAAVVGHGRGRGHAGRGRGAPPPQGRGGAPPPQGRGGQ